MKLIVGLGNPGEKYERTRHNLGFMVVESFLKDFEPVKKTEWENSSKFKSDIVQIDYKPKVGTLQKVILAKPKTYVNNSGLAVSLISQYLNISTSDIWIIHDDFDLPRGSLKIRFGGASAGHHGVESIIKVLNSDKFWRFRLGTGKQHQKLTHSASSGREIKNQKLRKLDDYVLSNFTGSEYGKVRELIKRGAKAISTALEEDLTKAMNRFNTK